VRVRRVATAVALTLAASTLAACGGSDSSSDKADEPEAGKERTLTYWASNQGTSIEHDKQVLQPELDKFTQRTGIKVKLEVVPWADLLNRILAATTSGKGPDILNIGNTWSASLQATDAFVPIDDAILAKVGGKDRFLGPSYAATGAVGKDPVALPVYSNAYGLYYNKKLFAEAGVDKVPETLAELKEAAPKLAAKKVAILDYPGKPEVSLNQSFYPFLWANGGSVFSPDGKSVAFNGPEGVESLQLLLDLKAAGGLPENTASKGNDIEGGALAGGKTALYHAATALQAVQLGTVIGAENVGIGLPLEGTKRVAFGIPGALVLAKHSKNKDAAKKFATFLSSPEVTADLAKESGFFPARTDVTVPEQSPEAQEFAKSLEYAFPGDTHPKARQVMGLIAPHIQAALLGKEDAKTALDAAADEATTLLGSGG